MFMPGRSSTVPSKVGPSKTPFPHTRIFVRLITILEFLKISVYRGNLRAKFQGHSSATSYEEGNKTLARRRHDVVR